MSIRLGPAEYVKLHRNQIWLLLCISVGLGLIFLDAVLPSKLGVIVSFIIVIHLMIARAYFFSDRRSGPK